MPRACWLLLVACCLGGCVRAGFTTQSLTRADGASRDGAAGPAEKGAPVERGADRPKCTTVAPAKITMNVGSRTTLPALGTPPFKYSLTSGEGEVSQEGIYWAPGHPTTATIGIADSVGCSVTATVAVGGSTLWILGGSNASGTTLDTIYRSTDGRSWTLAGHLPGARFLGSAVVYDNRLWYLGGSNVAETISYPEVWASKDGVTFTQTGKFPTARYAGGADVLRGRLWIAGGRGDTSTAWTVDGVTWTKASDLPVAVHSNNLLAFKDKLWIPGGHVSEYYAEVWTSPDGVTWSVAGMLPSGREVTGAAVYAKKLWVAGGRNASLLDEVVSSADGAAWNAVGHLPAPLDHGSMVEFNGRLWFACAGPQVYSSADGASWTLEATIPSVDAARMVAFTPQGP